MANVTHKIFVSASVLVGVLYFLIKFSDASWILVSYSALIGYIALIYWIICRGRRVENKKSSVYVGVIATLFLFATVIWPYYTFVHSWFRNLRLSETASQFPLVALFSFLVLTPLNATVLRMFLRTRSAQRGAEGNCGSEENNR